MTVVVSLLDFEKNGDAKYIFTINTFSFSFSPTFLEEANMRVFPDDISQRDLNDKFKIDEVVSQICYHICSQFSFYCNYFVTIYRFNFVTIFTLNLIYSCNLFFVIEVILFFSFHLN